MEKLEKRVKRVSLRLREINKANDVKLKEAVSDMIYVLKVTAEGRELTKEEIHALDILKEANTKKLRFYAVKRVNHIINKKN